MRRREKYLIHDRPISFTLMGMFFVSFLVVLNVIHIRNKQTDADKQLEKEHYKSERIYQYDSFAVTDLDKQEEKMNLKRLDITKGNVVLVFNTVVGNGYSIAPIHLAIVMNEPLVEEVKKGRFPTENEIIHGRKCVVIGEGLKRLTEKTQEGEVLKIDGINYDVIGMLKDNLGNGTDKRVIMFQNCYAESLLNELGGSYSYFVKYGSNFHDELETAKLLAWLHRFIPNDALKESENSSIESMDDLKNKAQLLREYIRFALYGLFLFCMIGCVIVSTIWIKRRRKEIVVRKALGSDLRTIVFVMFHDIGILMGTALLMSCVVIGLQSLLSGEAWIRKEYIVQNLLFLIVSFFFIMILTMVQPIYTAMKVSPAEGTKE